MLSWRTLLAGRPPSSNTAFLVKHLAYWLQELAYGGLSEETRARLEALAEDEAYADREQAKRRRIERPVTGTRLTREWQGVEHHVTVLDDGLEYQGRKYKSLSAIARAITGTRWNGPLFFGLHKHRSGK